MSESIVPIDHQARRSAALLSVVTNSSLTAIKVFAAAITGSVSLFSEAAHSATDVVASGIAYVSVHRAAQPADRDHPYGHGKFESMAGFAESILLLVIVAYVTVTSLIRLFRPEPVTSVDLGIWLVAASTVVVLLVGVRVRRIATETGSLALRSNAQHLFVDFWTNLGVLGALVTQRVTGWDRADPIVALGLAAWIGRNAWKMSQEAFNQLVDRSLPDDEILQIRTIVNRNPEVLGMHRLRTRLAGNSRTIDLHIVVPADWSVVRAHDLAESIEDEIAAELAPATVVIHVDPFDEAKAERRAKEA